MIVCANEQLRRNHSRRGTRRIVRNREACASRRLRGVVRRPTAGRTKALRRRSYFEGTKGMAASARRRGPHHRRTRYVLAFGQAFAPEVGRALRGLFTHSL